MFDTPFGSSWSGARWQDLALTVHWMLENAPAEHQQMLWDLAELVQLQGFDWKGFYGNDTFPTDAVDAATLYTHGVNNGMALKSGAVWYATTVDMKWNSKRISPLQSSGHFINQDTLLIRTLY